MNDRRSGSRAFVRRAAANPANRLGLALIAGYLYGWGIGRTPSPTDESAFWIGNLAAPFLIIGFLAGRWVSRSAMTASAAGALSAMAAVAGFYDFLMVGDVTNSQLDLPATVTARSVVLQSYGRWFANLLWGDPGGLPWLGIALVSGLLFGLLGYQRPARRVRLGAIAVGAALVVEPLIYLGKLNVPITGSAYGMGPRNLLIWGGEFLIGVLILSRSARAPRTAAAPAATPLDGLAAGPRPRSADPERDVTR